MKRERICLDYQDMPDEAGKLFRAAYPNYRGRKFALVGVDGPISVRSYWDGGSRTTFRVVRSDYAALALPSSHPVFDAVTGADEMEIPPGAAVVAHSIFCGKDMGLTLYVPFARLDGFRPPVAELGPDHQAAINIIAGYKSSYRKEYAERAGLLASWDRLKAELCTMGLLNKRGALTPAGRNAAKG